VIGELNESVAYKIKALRFSLHREFDRLGAVEKDRYLRRSFDTVDIDLSLSVGDLGNDSKGDNNHSDFCRRQVIGGLGNNGAGNARRFLDGLNPDR